MRSSSAWILSATRTTRTIFPTICTARSALPGRYSGAAYADFLLGLPQTTGLSNPGAKLVSARHHVELLRAGPVQGYAAAQLELWRALGIDAALYRQVRPDFQLQPVGGSAGGAEQRASVHQSAFPEDREDSDRRAGRLSRGFAARLLTSTTSIRASGWHTS